MDEFVCDRSFVLKNAFGWKRGAVVLAVFCFLFSVWALDMQCANRNRGRVDERSFWNFWSVWPEASIPMMWAQVMG